ncbi:MAG: diguanylate cyclase [Pseudomonadota bacterium]
MTAPHNKLATIQDPLSHRVLVVDNDSELIAEYVHCLSDEFEADDPTSTLTDLEKVWLRDESDEGGVASFDVHSRNQGQAAVEAVAAATRAGRPFAIVFLDRRLPPGIDGLEAAKQIREIDPNVNLVIVSDSLGDKPDKIAREIPPADKIFFFEKPFMGVECRQLAAALCGKWNADRALRMANEALEQRVGERTAALHKLAYYDPVTRLPNQFLLLDELDATIDSSEDDEGDAAVVLLDVDRFSFLNETMGYDSGTELLRSIGNRLSRTFIEDGDYPGAIVGRFGSDEFAVIIPGVASEDETRRLAEAVKNTVEAPFLIHGRDLFLKCSVGVAWHPVHGRTARAVFRCAEAALHRSMRSIESPITYYHREMRYRARHRFALEAELRMALAGGRIRAWYQPQQSIATGELVGVEALARWEREDGTIIPPSEFIPISEEMGMADAIFESILKCAR